MNKKLWQKDASLLHPAIEAYTVGEDYVLDRELLPFDVQASTAHAQMLGHIGILTAQEVSELSQGLSTMLQDWNNGAVTITVHDEDCHTVIENYLTKKLGTVGKKIHTGRSRNDQVLVALRLYMKHHLLVLQKQTLTLAQTFLDAAETYQQVPLPGYSHTQQAMLSSVGHYMASMCESLLDDAALLRAVKKYINKNPLGSAAGFGVALPLDREYTTQKLEFEHTQINSLYCQNSRGKFESIFLEGLVQIMMTLGKFANDILLFTSQEFDFFTLDPSLVTGSSIMPQKKNLDVMEIVRGNVSVVMGHQHTIQNIAKNLISGYNRDLQLIKKPLFDSVQIVEHSLDVMQIVMSGIVPNEEEIKKKITSGIFMADAVNELVQKQGMTFRDAYQLIAKTWTGQDVDLKKNITSKVSLGAPGNLGLDVYKERIKEMSQ